MEAHIKFGFVALCLLLCLSYGNHVAQEEDAQWLRCAMFCTVAADFALLILNWKTLGVAFFGAVQLCYGKRYHGRWLPQWPIGLKVAAVVIVVLVAGRFSLLYGLSAGYAMLFAHNLYRVFQYAHEKTMPAINHLLCCVGMVLFALCDINVALYNVLGYKTAFVTLVWVFYAPSQLCLALSGKRFSR